MLEHRAGQIRKVQKLSEVQSINIIEDAEGEMRVATSVMARGMELEHRQVIRAVRNFQADLEQFGRVDFEDQAFETAGGTQHREIARLNEHQATFLLTSFRNIGRVKEFKVALVKEFYTMRQALAQPTQVALPSARQLALMVIEAEDARAAAEQKAVEMQPKADYVDRFVGPTSDAITVDVFASQFGSTGPKVRDLLVEKNIAVRKCMGERWSSTEQRMKKEYEWRARQGVRSSGWFDLRPQHNAPRLHNGQVKQTMYVLQYHAHELAIALGLVPPVRAVEAVAS